MWKILLKYLPTNKEIQKSSLNRKREEYIKLYNIYFEKTNDFRDEKDQKIMKIILADVPRTQPDLLIFRSEKIQEMLIHILFIWHARHPASGYVQGINDLVVPFIMIFTNDYIEIDFENFKFLDEKLKLTEQEAQNIEADSYWCLCKILDYILDNYTFSGIEKSFGKIIEIVKKIDLDLYKHFVKQGQEVNIQEGEIFQFFLGWVNCLLVRELSPNMCFRLFDTYISVDEGFSVMHLYVCSALFLKFGKKFLEMDYCSIMKFLRNIPSREWEEEELKMVIAEAYVFKNIFEQGNFNRQDVK